MQGVTAVKHACVSFQAKPLLWSMLALHGARPAKRFPGRVCTYWSIVLYSCVDSLASPARSDCILFPSLPSCPHLACSPQLSPTTHTLCLLLRLSRCRAVAYVPFSARRTHTGGDFFACSLNLGDSTSVHAAEGAHSAAISCDAGKVAQHPVACDASGLQHNTPTAAHHSRPSTTEHVLEAWLRLIGPRGRCQLHFTELCITTWMIGSVFIGSSQALCSVG